MKGEEFHIYKEQRGAGRELLHQIQQNIQLTLPRTIRVFGEFLAKLPELVPMPFPSSLS